MTLLLDSGKKTMTYSVYTFKDRVAKIIQNNLHNSPSCLGAAAPAHCTGITWEEYLVYIYFNHPLYMD